jgi:hypothetical protein
MSSKFEASLLSVAELQAIDPTSAEALVVPAYQRAFCWTDKQIEVLVQDLVTHFTRYSEDETCRYSLGTIVCHQREKLEVLDGQQRLTSIDVLLAVLGRREADTEQNPEFSVTEEEFRKWDPTLIREYANLTLEEGKDIRGPNISEKILSSVCHKINEAVRERLIFSNEEGISPIEKFIDCIRKSVCVLRVILPIDDRNAYEGPAMYEIVNMRGQALRSIDIAKATVVEKLKFATDAERLAFDRLWTGVAGLLRTTPQTEAKGILEAMHKELATKTEASEPDDRGGGLKFNAIVANARHALKTKLTQIAESEEDDSSDEKRFVVDFENLFVIANEIFRWTKVKDADEAKYETLNIRPRPGETEYRGLHERIVVGKDLNVDDDKLDQERHKDVWRFMSVLWIAAIVARQVNDLKNRDSTTKKPFELLIDTFYAANGYQYSGQYWLLSLVHTAIQELCPGSRLPESAEAFVSAYRSVKILPDQVNKSFKRGYLRLLLWGLKRFNCPNEPGSMTERVIKLGADEGVDKLKDSVINEFKVIGKCQESDKWFESWQYPENGVRWKLFFIDWLLWVDYKKSGGFVNLQTQVSKHAGLVDSLNVEGIKDDPLSIFQDEFKTKVNAGMRIVSRSQIEHWIAQKTETIKDTTVLHHFSNLALINTSENIRNSNKTTDQKNIQVGENPSAKLLWLAWFARASANKQSELANHLCTDKMDGFWADYIASFAECNEVVS